MSKPRDRFRMTVEYTVEPSKNFPNNAASERMIIRDGMESIYEALKIADGTGSIRKITVEKVR